MLRPVPVRRTLTQTDTGGPLTATTYQAQLRHCHSTLLLLHRWISPFSPASSLLSDWNYTFFQINIACGPDSCLELFLRKNLFDVWNWELFSSLMILFYEQRWIQIIQYSKLNLGLTGGRESAPICGGIIPSDYRQWLSVRAHQFPIKVFTNSASSTDLFQMLKS